MISLQVRDFLLWCTDAHAEIDIMEPICKRAAEDFATIHSKLSQGLQENVRPSAVSRSDSGIVSKSIDHGQAEILRANNYRMTTELEEYWKPTLMQLVAEGEKMIDENHYAAEEVSKSL